MRIHYKNDHPGLSSIVDLTVGSVLDAFLMKYSREDMREHLCRLFTPQELTVVEGLAKQYPRRPFESCRQWLKHHPEPTSTEREIEAFVENAGRRFVHELFKDHRAWPQTQHKASACRTAAAYSLVQTSALVKIMEGVDCTPNARTQFARFLGSRRINRRATKMAFSVAIAGARRTSRTSRLVPSTRCTSMDLA